MLVSLVVILMGQSTEGFAKQKGKGVPRPEPELKIVEFSASPIPYHPQEGPFQFVATVQLPKEVDEQWMLEVSALVTSPSMTSLRFLSIRQPVNEHVQTNEATNGDAAPKRVRVDLTWDGLDHNKQQAPAGSYEYEVRVKLLSNGEKGQRTQMLSWPKRGKFAVKE
ncbi:MAG: hypothetical protein NBKEAIPA_02018 [Nitrospirae bacterium]|nr:MAG: hypothetical protein UZ03_NOB001002148 [Nitrospira sp. OLB3]MBV6470105.1 hypothetical protein [Nitrospirota bacterium]MCE7965000.1 hypothetical protein [Nitrospira sp. NTP2]MCK6492974.1 hypothetical protein [Nitrospira sp.]MEB2337930.1 hypothetical protein [Nitrospirales bacterium]